MPIYITMLKNTQKGAETIKEAPPRMASGAQAIQQAGGRVIGASRPWAATTTSTSPSFPDTKAGWPVLVQTAMRGAVSGETMEAIPIDEFIQIVNKV
jgi:uncharacterized protein with GYD domain